MTNAKLNSLEQCVSQTERRRRLNPMGRPKFNPLHRIQTPQTDYDKTLHN